MGRLSLLHSIGLDYTHLNHSSLLFFSSSFLFVDFQFDFVQGDRVIETRRCIVVVFYAKSFQVVLTSSVLVQNDQYSTARVITSYAY